jgi:hypothetical protein
MSKANKPQSNGAKAAACVRCQGTIPPYAGRKVAAYRDSYAHHPGQCRDSEQRSADLRKVAQQTMFAWQCAHIEPGSNEPAICNTTGVEPGTYTAHMKAHGSHALKPSEPAPRRKLGKPEVPVFKWLGWTERKYGDWQPGIGNPLIGEAERRGQFLSEGPYPHTVWVIPFTHAPWESTARPPAPVVLYIIEPGRYTTDWSEAKRERREASRRAKYGRAA